MSGLNVLRWRGIRDYYESGNWYLPEDPVPHVVLTAIALTDLLRAGTAGALVDENRRLRAELKNALCFIRDKAMLSELARLRS